MTAGVGRDDSGGRSRRQYSLFPPGRRPGCLPPLSFRSEARNLVFPLRSDPAAISPYGRDDSGGGRDDSGGDRDDSGGRSRRQRGQVEMTAGEGRDEGGRENRR